MIFRELSETEKHAEELYAQAIRLINKRRSLPADGKVMAYKLLDEAATLKHKEAMKLMGKCF